MIRRAAALFAAVTIPVLCLARPAPGAAPGVSPLPRHAPPAMRRVWAARQSGLCLFAIRAAEARYHLPQGTLGAISRVETGRPMPVTGDRQPWPWTVNAAGVRHWYDSRAAAASDAGRLLVATRGNVDVGCMQVNLRYHRDAFPSLEAALDPAINVDVGARLLVGLAGAHGWARATQLYHSATPSLGLPYGADVARMRHRQRATLADARASGPAQAPKEAP